MPQLLYPQEKVPCTQQMGGWMDWIGAKQEILSLMNMHLAEMECKTK
jgi:hypothetical protein